MSDVSSPDTLESTAPDARRHRFENAWRAWQPGHDIPRWQQFLPAPEESCSPDGIAALLRLDIECRILAGLPALLSERYFEHPRLQQADARLDAARQVELIHEEYQQRWQRGQRPRRTDYESAFPQHAASLRRMQPRSRCPRCDKPLILEETLETLLCPDCGCESELLITAPPLVPGAMPTAAMPNLDGRAYELREPLGEGGMGEVYRSCDPALDRDLAIKVMKASLRGHPRVEQRFLREARIAGSLQHPGIVAVHNLGRLPDGRLHYTMRLVRGRTFAAILKDEAGQPERLPYLLTIFEKICQTAAYAHSKRVIHRDLKPSNVMVGKFGEVQVMDWGLAKVLGSEDAAAESEEWDAAGTRIPEEADTPLDLTRPGSGFGTPAYMPVEQALGEWDAVDERADVFALGSILCELLTGGPAYRGANAEEVSRQAKRGDVTEALARLEQCAADAALIELCRECLSPQREARPRNADAVAKRVAQYQAEVQERLRRAELERVQAEGERLAAELRAAEEQKRRRVQRALALAVVLLAGIGLAFGWWQAERSRAERERQARNAEALADLLYQCERALRAGDAVGAAVMLEEAQKRATEAGVPNEAERLARCQDDLAVLRDLDAADRFRWTPLGSKMPALEAVTERYREALSYFRADPDAVGGKAAAARMSDSAVRERLTAALDRLLWARKSAAVRAALQALDPDPFRDAVRDAVCSDDRTAFARLVAQPEALAQPPGFIAFLGDRGVIDDPGRRRALLWTALQRRPGDLGLLMGLGGSYPLNHWQGAEERVRWFQAAVTAAPTNLATYNSLGLALHDKGDLDGAVAAYREALHLDPKYPWGHNNLGWALQNKGDLEGAIAAYQEAIHLDPTLALPHDNLGEALQAKGDLDGAFAAHKEAHRLDPQFAWPHNNLGLLLYYKKDLDGAITAFRRSIQLDPKYAKSRNNLGMALEAKGNLPQAIAVYQEAIRIDSRTARFRDNLSRAQRLRDLLPRLPDVLTGKDKPKSPAEACDFALLSARSVPKRYAESVQLFGDAFAVDPQLAEDRKASHRYNAACCAALAGCGKGADTASRADNEKARLRGQALTWLRADLTQLQHLAGFGESVQCQDAAAQLAHWLIDADFAGVRPGPDQVEMPAEERAAWDKLWVDVRATLALAQKSLAVTSGK